MNIKKYIIGAVILAAFIAYVVIFHNEQSADMAHGTSPSTATPVLNSGANAFSNTAATQSGASSSISSGTGGYRDGTYTGEVADAFYGNLQVSVTISGGKIINVQFPQYPQGGHSSDVSETALPELAQEAIAAQSANVNVVSGATQDSQAFQQSMASALLQAQG